MYDGMFVFDNVIHMCDNTPHNLTPRSNNLLQPIMGAAKLFSVPGKYDYNEKFDRSGMTVEEAHRRIFDESDTDMVVAQAVPIFGWFKDGFAPAELNASFAAAYPEKVLFCGAVDPLYHGLSAVHEMERQVAELNARTFKFYQTQLGSTWRCDDRKLAYPLYEKCLELGINHVQFHKGLPFGPDQPLEPLRCHDLEQPALDFPELNFVIHHLGDPYIDETANIAARHQNISMALSSWINMHPIWPMESFHRLGKLLFWVGADRLYYGSEAFVWPNVQQYIELLASLEMPEELQEGYGYPALTREIKEKIFGLNYARLMGVDVEAKKAELAKKKEAA